MKNYKKAALLAAMISMVCAVSVYAKVRAVMSRRSFEKSLSYKGLVVALFYEDKKGDRQLRDKNRALIRMYEDLSTYPHYDNADIIFLQVNAGRKDLTDLASLYGVTQFPTIICFNNGKRIADDNGMNVALRGFVSRTDTQAFIDKYCGQKIRRYIAAKRDRARDLVQGESQAWKPYYYPRDIMVKGYEPEEREENME